MQKLTTFQNDFLIAMPLATSVQYVTLIPHCYSHC